MDYQARIQRFQQAAQGKADLVFLSHSADLEYLTGVPRAMPTFGATIHPGQWIEGILMTPQHEPVLLLPRMSAEFNALGSQEGIEIRVLGDWDDPLKLAAEVIERFDLPAAPRVAIGNYTTGETVSNLQKILPDASFVSATDITRELRTIKSEEEIAIMRRAGQITEQAFAAVVAQLKIGMTELDIISEVDHQLRKYGGLGPSFTTSLYNSGPNHPLMMGQHEATWPRVLTAPVAILFDFGAVYEGFCYDYGRTVCFGQPEAEMQRVYDLVMRAQAAGVAAMKAGEATCEQIDAAARQVIEEAGYGQEFRHRLGHGIGMDVHEPPFLTRGSSTVVQEGMLFTVEPSIMQFETFSARVEDVVVARPGGGEKLTNGFQELIVIE